MNISYQKDNTHFTSTRLGTVNLYKVKHNKKVGFEQAFITMLDDKDASDADVVKKLKDLWIKNSDKKLQPQEAHLVKMESRGLCDNFAMCHNNFANESRLSPFYEPNQKRVFLAIEQPGKSPLEKRILGFAKIRDIANVSGKTELSFLVVNPLFLAGNKKRKLSGIGETLFAKTMQICKEGGFKSFCWGSDNNPYYFNILNKKHANIDLRQVFDGWSYFSIPQKIFDNFLNYFDKKYNMNFSSSSVEKEISSFHIDS